MGASGLAGAALFAAVVIGATATGVLCMIAAADSRFGSAVVALFTSTAPVVTIAAAAIVAAAFVATEPTAPESSPPPAVAEAVPPALAVVPI